jgi:hypothetical protein
MPARALLLVAVLAIVPACAARVFVPPPGPGAPAPEGPAAWAEATSACRDIKDASGTLRVSVRQGRLRSTGIDVGFVVTADGKVRLEDSTAFTLAGTATQAQLWLRQDNRIVKGRADEIVDAFIGVRLGPERLLAVVTGCHTTDVSSARPQSAVRYDKRIAVPVSDGTVYLQKKDGRWRTSEGVGEDITVEYKQFSGYWPSNWLASPAKTSADPIFIEVSVEDPEMNKGSINPLTFQVAATGAVLMSLEELRASGPLRGRTR